MRSRTRSLHFGFHLRHINGHRTFAFAGLAAHTKLHRIRHLVRRKRILIQLTAQRQPQHIGAPTCQILFQPGHPERRAHNAARAFAAGPVVVAHLRRAAQPTGPIRPIKHSLRTALGIAFRPAHQTAIIHFGRTHDLAGVQCRFGVKPVFDLLKNLHHARAIHAFMKL